MAKLPVTILVLRILQLGLGIAFIVFWTWSCAANYAVGGGAGEYFLGYFTSLVSLAVCIHGIWAFAKGHHRTDHRALYHNVRWATDLMVVCLWLGVILISVLVSVPDEDAKRELGGEHSGDSSSSYPSASDPIVVVGMGVNVTDLFSAITFMMTALLLVISAVKARKIARTPEANFADDKA